MTDENSQPSTIAELSTRIARGRAELEEWLATLTQAQLTTPRQEGWSIKDHLVHIAAWEAGITALFRGESRFAAMGVDMSKVAPDDFSAINQQIFERNKELS